MYKCKYCHIQSEYKYNIDRHEKSKHGNNKNESAIKEQSTQIQSGGGSVVTSTKHIPMEKYNEALDMIHKLKALYRNSKKEKWNMRCKLIELL